MPSAPSRSSTSTPSPTPATPRTWLRSAATSATYSCAATSATGRCSTSLFATHKPRAVVHFAAESHVDRSIHGPGDFIRTNVNGTFTLLEAARAHWSGLPADEKAAFRFLHVSTDEVYGTLAHDDPAFCETDTYEPNSPYSASKAASDHLVRAWHHTYGLPTLTTNCSNNYGPYHFPEKLIPLMIVNALAGKPLPVYGDGQQVRDWLYVKDHCAAIREVLARGRVGETYNVGGWNEKPNLEIVHTVCGLLDEMRGHADGPYARLVTHVTDRPGHDRRYAIDARKIERELGWRPAETFETGLRKTVRWYLDNAAWVEARPDRRLPPVAVGQLRQAPGVTRILLLGKNGQVGWELQRSLAVLGEVVAVDFDSAPPLRADFSEPESLAALVRSVRPDLIVNAAAHTAVDKAESEPELAFAINATAVGVLAREAAASGAWLVHYSTDYVFDGSGSEAWSEHSPTGPLSVYGGSKLEGEELVRRSGCRHLIFRTSWVYAARGGNFAKTMLRLARTRDALDVIDDQIGAPTGADLLADVTAHALRAVATKPELAGTYHVVASGETSWHGYASHVIEFARARGDAITVGADAIRPIPTSAYPLPAERPKNSRLDTTKFRSAFGLALPSWRSGVERMLGEVLAAPGA